MPPLISPEELESFFLDTDPPQPPSSCYAITERPLFSSLIGKTVLQVNISEDESLLEFVCVEGRYFYLEDGDCCSSVWLADIWGACNLRGTVLSTQEVELNSYDTLDGRTRQQEDIVYGYKIRTSKGLAVLSIRNSSNGYYGGSFREMPLLYDHSWAKLREIPLVEVWQAD